MTDSCRYTEREYIRVCRRIQTRDPGVWGIEEAI
jgi:hypothetical protein